MSAKKAVYERLIRFYVLLPMTPTISSHFHLIVAALWRYSFPLCGCARDSFAFIEKISLFFHRVELVGAHSLHVVRRLIIKCDIIIIDRIR